MTEVAVHRFPLPNPHGGSELVLPVGAQVCSFRRKGKKFNLWVILNPHNIREPREFLVVATGDSWPVHEWNYVQTSHDVWGDEPHQHEVWHLLERRKDGETSTAGC